MTTPHSPEYEEIQNKKRYTKACRDVGFEFNVPVVDIWTSFLVHAGWTKGEAPLGSRDTAQSVAFRSLFSDGAHNPALCLAVLACITSLLIVAGLHLTSAGYQLEFEQAMKYSQAHYLSIDPDNMQCCYPPWETAPKSP